MGTILRFSATLSTALGFAPQLLAQEQPEPDPAWIDAAESDADGATPDARRLPPPSDGPPLSDAVLPASDAALPPPPTPPTGADAYAWVELREPRVPVRLTGSDRRLKFKLYSQAKGMNRKLAIFVCRNPCQVLLPRGEYRVHVTGGPEHADGERVIDVADATSFYFSLPDRATKNAGLGIGIAGTAMLPVGLFILFMTAWGDSCYHCSVDERRNREAPAGIYIGLGIAAVGAVLTPVGWVMFGSNRKPRVKEAPVATRRPARAPRFAIGAAPISGGAAAGVWGTF
jgi:hypothetical protein